MVAQEFNLLIVDGDNWAYKNFFANSQLSFNGKLTGAIFGFLNSLIKLHKKYTDNIIVTWSHNNNFRKNIYPEYKETRDKEGKEDYFRQQKILKEILSSLGIVQVMMKDLEADDAIRSIIRIYPKTIKILIVSEDKDLLQLIDKNVFQLKNDIIFDRNKVYEKYNIYPEQIPLYLSLVGDRSDNIQGVPGIGKKRASYILNKYPEFLTKGIPDSEKPSIKKILDFKDLIERNLLITDLECAPLRFPEDNLIKLNPDKNKLLRLLAENGITSILKELDRIYERR